MRRFCYTQSIPNPPPMKILHLLLALAAAGIGVYMTLTYWGAALPPTLSGLAFIALGLNQLMMHK